MGIKTAAAQPYGRFQAKKLLITTSELELDMESLISTARCLKFESIRLPVVAEFEFEV